MVCGDFGVVYGSLRGWWGEVCGISMDRNYTKFDIVISLMYSLLPKDLTIQNLFMMTSLRWMGTLSEGATLPFSFLSPLLMGANP